MKRETGEVHISPEYEMMEEFLYKNKIPFEEKRQWNINFFNFQTKEEAEHLMCSLIKPNRGINLKGNPAYDLMM